MVDPQEVTLQQFRTRMAEVRATWYLVRIPCRRRPDGATSDFLVHCYLRDQRNLIFQEDFIYDSIIDDYRFEHFWIKDQNEAILLKLSMG
jgi:hypothetical protein